MIKTRVRVTSCLLWVFFTLLSLYPPGPARAERYTVTQTQQDFYFVSSEQMTMTIRSYAWEYGIDSMLWVYSDTETLITANDDYFGLDSYVSFGMQPNVTYRVRAGVCCGDPNRWYGNSYQIEPNMAPTNVVTTTTEETTPTSTVAPTTTQTVPPTTTTIPPTTTSTSTSTTTTSTSTTTTTSSTTTTTVAPTTVPDIPTTTEASTTTVAVPPTTTSTTSTTVAQTTTTRPTVPETTTTSSTTIPPSTIPESTTTTTVPPTVESPLANLTTQAITELVSGDALQELPEEELVQFFEELNFDQLTDEQQEAFVAAISEADDGVKKTFEDTVNIYNGDFEEYVPYGSAVTVQARKVVIAATGVLFVAPAVPTSSTSSATESRKGRRV